jgi:hypothetical protein
MNPHREQNGSITPCASLVIIHHFEKVKRQKREVKEEETQKAVIR